VSHCMIDVGILGAMFSCTGNNVHPHRIAKLEVKLDKCVTPCCVSFGCPWETI
jgi:hypothetical protein